VTDANPERGEHSLELAGVAYRLRPEFGATVAIEQKTGRSLLELVAAGNRGALSLTQIGVIAGAYIRAGADPDDKLTRGVKDERVAELAYQDGVGRVMPVLTLVLLDAVTGGRAPEGEAEAAAA
jgi:hypothetical protein